MVLGCILKRGLIPQDDLNHYSQAIFKKKSDLETISTTLWSTGKDRCPESACLQLPENCHHANNIKLKTRTSGG